MALQACSVGRPMATMAASSTKSNNAAAGLSSSVQGSSVSMSSLSWAPVASTRARPALQTCRKLPGQIVATAGYKVDSIQELDTSLETEAGVLLKALRDKLAAGEWEAADAETRRLLCELAGEEAVKRKWVFFSEVQFISEADLRLVDGLWRAYSNNKFGYSVQRKIWNNAGKNWNAFFKKVGWTRPLDEYQDTYKKFPLEFMWDVADPTPEGHLPLTNALRGTRLLEYVLNHPAFADVDQEQKLQTGPNLSGLFGSSSKSR